MRSKGGGDSDEDNSQNSPARVLALPSWRSGSGEQLRGPHRQLARIRLTPPPAQQTTTGGLAISVRGRTLVQIGTATATTSGSSLAIAFDLPNAGASTATANGDHNFALAINGSTATANGNGNFVFAGDDSTATATGDNNDVRAAFGSTNHVSGNDNTSFAIPNSDARGNREQQPRRVALRRFGDDFRPERPNQDERALPGEIEFDGRR